MFSKRSVETPRLIMVTTYTNMSNSHFDYNTFSHCRWYSIPTSANMFLSIPPRWLSMVMLSLLQLTQLSSQLTTKISTIKNFQISYIYKENRKTFATLPTLVLSEYKRISDSLAVDCMHAWRAYFCICACAHILLWCCVSVCGLTFLLTRLANHAETETTIRIWKRRYMYA